MAGSSKRRADEAAGVTPRDWLWLVLALIIFSAVAVRILATRTYWPRYDSGAYISAAVSLADGCGLRDITAPVMRPDEGWAQVPFWVRNDPQAMATANWPPFVLYPPLLPLMLAPIVVAGGGAYLPMQLLMLAFGAAGLAALYVFRHRLFPEIWKPTLILSAGSMLALYSTRVQSEAVLVPLIVIATAMLARSVEREDRLLRAAMVAALVLLIASAVHTKVIFVSIAMVAWVVVGYRGPIARRFLAASGMVIVAIVPVVVFLQTATWAGVSDDGTAVPPALGMDGWSVEHESVLSAEGLREIAFRIPHGGWQFLASTGVYLPRQIARSNLRAGPVAMVAWVVFAIGLWAMRRNAGGLISWIVGAHVLGMVLLPWTEPRMFVPVMPFLIAVLIAGFREIVGVLGDLDSERVQRGMAMAVVAAVLLQEANWVIYEPAADNYCTAHHEVQQRLVAAELAAKLPTKGAVLMHEDNYSLALASGMPAVSLSPAEWKQTHAAHYLLAGGRGAAFYALDAELDANNRTTLNELRTLAGGIECAERSVRQREFTVCSVNGGIEGFNRETPSVKPAVAPAHGRVHPRWLRLGPDERGRLHREAFGFGAGNLPAVEGSSDEHGGGSLKDMGYIQ